MERLTISAAMPEADENSSGWLVDNVWHPFLNGTGAKQIYNNFVSEKLDPWYVPHAEALSRDWVAQTLSSAAGAVLTYAAAGKLAGKGLACLSAKTGLEGRAARLLQHQASAQILGAGAFDFCKSPYSGETRLGNAAGSMAAFAVFGAGNNFVGKYQLAVKSNLFGNIGRVTVGAAGGLTGLETARFVSGNPGAPTRSVTADERWHAALHGGFINTALPLVHKVISREHQHSVDSRASALQSKESRSSGLLEPVRAEHTSSSAVKGDKPSASAADPIKVILLKQQFEAAPRKAQMEMVATELANFIGGAKKSLFMALYDLRLKDPVTERTIIDALNNRAESNVDVRIAYFQPNKSKAITANALQIAPAEAPPLGPSPEFLAKLSPKIRTQVLREIEPVPPETIFPRANKGAGGGSPLIDRAIDIQNGNNGDLGSGVGMTGITGGGRLMHHKYICRDPGTRNAAVWTGSTNITDSAFGMQDNNIVIIRSRPLAKVFQTNFNELWDKGSLSGTGKDLTTTARVGDSTVTVSFSPGDGNRIEADFANAIATANSKIYIASMVISSQKMLQALADQVDAGRHIVGIYDGPQMRNVANAWARSSSPDSAVKIALWQKVKGSLVAKSSHPYDPGGPHDFMHNKTLVTGDEVRTGSFNFSMNATRNAENVVVIKQADLAQQYARYIEDLVKSYRGVPRRTAEK